MHVHVRRPTRERHSWLTTCIAVLAMVAQLGFALAPLAETADRQMAAHVEADGAQTHVSHSEATCASCQARSIHGSAPRPQAPAPDIAGMAIAPVASSDPVAPVALTLQDNPRAPPR